MKTTKKRKLTSAQWIPISFLGAIIIGTLLLMLPADKRFRSSDISKQAGSSRLHFAEPEYMEALIDCAPGSASVMGLINDKDKQVQLLVDEAVLKAEWVGCHPCINTSSLRIRATDLFGRVLEAAEHGYIVVRA